MDLINFKHFYHTSTDPTLQSNLNTHSAHNQLISLTQPYTLTPLAKLESDLYIKPMDRTLLLHQTSFHPQSCKDAIIYSQALRYRCIITDNNLLQKRLNDLLITLVHRGYKKETIQTAFNKVLQHTQNDLLYKSVNNQKNNSPIFSITYNYNTKHIAQILHKHWNIIENDPTLRILWAEPPIVAYQRNKNLKDNLVQTKLT